MTQYNKGTKELEQLSHEINGEIFSPVSEDENNIS